jgi:plastocyanin
MKLMVSARMLVAACGLVLAACARSPRTHEVAIRDFKFQPDTLRVHAGDTIVWRNYDFVPHSATADDRAWDSGSIAANQVWPRASFQSGQHPYYCVLHPNMRGVLIVD